MKIRIFGEDIPITHLFFSEFKMLMISTHGDFQSGPLDFNDFFEQKEKRKQ